MIVRVKEASESRTGQSGHHSLIRYKQKKIHPDLGEKNLTNCAVLAI